jgi:hypothetical protein
VKLSTHFLLLAEFGTGTIPVVEFAAKYFGYDEDRAKREAALGNYPFPVFRLGSNKTTWLVDIEHVADYLDKVKNKAKAEFNAAK